MSFKRWSELNEASLEELKPNFGYQSWNSLSEVTWSFLLCSLYSRLDSNSFQLDKFTFHFFPFFRCKKTLGQLILFLILNCARIGRNSNDYHFLI